MRRIIAPIPRSASDVIAGMPSSSYRLRKLVCGTWQQPRLFCGGQDVDGRDKPGHHHGTDLVPAKRA
jgi:hypothetical protein